MNIETGAELLKLKGLLNNVTHISYTFSEVNKNNPIYSLDEERAQKIITIYKHLISEVKKINISIQNIENGKSGLG